MSAIPYKCLVIDDEPPAIWRLLDLLAQFPDTFEVIGQAANGREAIGLIETLQPDLIFLDIQMPGMSGFEMLNQLTKIPMVVFCTAFDQYALQAFETNSVDYLVKPVRLERLEQTVAKLKLFKHDDHSEQVMAFLREWSTRPALEPVTSITIRIGNKLHFIKLDDISYFKAGDKYISLFTKKGEEHITDKTLTQLEAELPHHFLRMHRSIIINTHYVKDIQKSLNCKYSIQLTDYYQTRVTSGRQYQEHIKQWVG